MAVPYPSNPAVGDQFTYGGVVYTWNGVAWTFTVTNTPGSVGSVAVTAPITNSGTPTAPVIGISQGALTIAQSQVTNLVSDLAGKASTSDLTSGLALKANLAGGNAFTQAQTITGTVTTSTPLTLKGASGQTASLFELRNASNTLLSYTLSNGDWVMPNLFNSYAGVGTGYSDYQGTVTSLYVRPTATTRTGAIIKGLASQTADLLQLQNSAGTATSFIDAAGNFRGGIAGHQFRAFNEDSKKVKFANWYLSDTDQWGQGQLNNELFFIGINSGTSRRIGFYLNTPDNGIGSLTTNANMYVTLTGIGINTPAANVTSQLQVTSGAAARVGQIIRGVASQTANLQEWQNSAASVVARVEPTGKIVGGQNITALGSIHSFNIITSGTSEAQLGSATLSIGTRAAGNIGAVIRGATSQTADLQQWQNSAGVANLKINSIGDINGTIVNGSYPITYNIMTGHNPEGKLTANPMLVNDIAYARLRGSTFTWTGLTPSNSDIDAMFNASSSFWNVAAGSFPATQVIQFTSPVTLTFGAFFGISFGNSGWAVRDITLEAFSEGVWKTVATTTSNSSEVFMGAIPTNAGVGTTQFRITLATPLGAAVRITHIFAYNFASPLAKNIYLGRDGGTMLGDVQGAGKLIGFGFGRFGSDIAFTDSTALRVTPSATTNVGAIIRGQASQTADLQQWQNSAGTNLARIKADGTPTFSYGTFFGQQTLSADADTVKPLVIRQFSGTHSANLTEWQNSAGSGAFTWINNSGYLRIGGDAGGKLAVVATAASERGIVIRGAASQTANLQEWQNSAGTVVARVEPAGNFIISGIGVTSGDHRVGTSTYFSAALNVLARATTEKGLVVRGQASQTANHFETQDTSGTTRFYIDSAHNANFSSASWFQNSTGKLTIGLISDSAVGLTVRGTGSGGVYTQTANLQEWLSFTGSGTTVLSSVTSAGNFNTGQVRSGTTSGLAQITGIAGSASTVGLIIRGAASQTADLTQWQNSAGTVLSEITSSGSFYVNSNNNTIGIEFLGNAGTQLITANGNDMLLRPRFDVLFAPAASSGRLRPSNDNTSDLGTSGQRWKTLFASGATLNSLTLTGTTSPITLNGSVGTSGQVLTSAGAGATPTWTTVSGGSFTGGTLTSNLTLAVGTTSLSPLTFQSGTNLTTVTAGANEYDGTVYYQTSNITPGRALKTQNYYYISSSDFFVDFSESGAVQSMIGGPTTGITVAAGTTYEYEIELAVQHQFLATSGVQGTFQIVNSTVSGSPTVAVTSYVDYGSNTTSFVTATTMSSVRTTGNVTFIPTISSGSRYAILRAKGIIRVTGTGTTKIYPGLSASSTNDNTWTVQSGLIFNLTPIGNGTVTTVGTWT
jgi:hypothetical protein